MEDVMVPVRSLLFITLFYFGLGTILLMRFVSNSSDLPEVHRVQLFSIVLTVYMLWFALAVDLFIRWRKAKRQRRRSLQLKGRLHQLGESMKRSDFTRQQRRIIVLNEERKLESMAVM